MYPKHLFRFIRHFRSDRWYRTRIMVPTSMICNGAFALFHLTNWIIDRSSDWFLFLAGYYASIMFLRIHLTRSKNRIDSAPNLEICQVEKKKTIRRTGIYLFLVAAAVSMVSIQILFTDHDFYYPLWNLLLLTGYSLMAFTFAAMNMIHDHLEDWLIRSTRAVSLVGAITGLYVLTASIFVYTGYSSDLIHTLLEVESTGVFLIIICISLNLIKASLGNKTEFNPAELIKKYQR